MKNNWIDVLDESLVKDFYNNQTSEEQQEGLILHCLLARLVLEEIRFR